MKSYNMLALLKTIRTNQDKTHEQSGVHAGRKEADSSRLATIYVGGKSEREHIRDVANNPVLNRKTMKKLKLKQEVGL